MSGGQLRCINEHRRRGDVLQGLVGPGGCLLVELDGGGRDDSSGGGDVGLDRGRESRGGGSNRRRRGGVMGVQLRPVGEHTQHGQSAVQGGAAAALVRGHHLRHTR